MKSFWRFPRICVPSYFLFWEFGPACLLLDQGMQVRFTNLRCFIEEECKVITQGCREGRMFILETNEFETSMFAKEQKVKSDIDL